MFLKGFLKEQKLTRKQSENCQCSCVLLSSLGNNHFSMTTDVFLLIRIFNWFISFSTWETLRMIIFEMDLQSWSNIKDDLCQPTHCMPENAEAWWLDGAGVKAQHPILPDPRAPRLPPTRLLWFTIPKLTVALSNLLRTVGERVRPWLLKNDSF